MNGTLTPGLIRKAKAVLSTAHSPAALAIGELDKINRRIDEDILEVWHQHWLQEIFAERRAWSLAGNPFA